jgi:hypothetical protein
MLFLNFLCNQSIYPQNGVFCSSSLILIPDTSFSYLVVLSTTFSIELNNWVSMGIPVLLCFNGDDLKDFAIIVDIHLLDFLYILLIKCTGLAALILLCHFFNSRDIKTMAS